MKKLLLIFTAVFINTSYLYSASLEEYFIFYILSGNTDKVLYCINDKKVNINFRDENGVTGLMYSIIVNKIEITKILIKKGVNLDLKKIIMVVQFNVVYY